MKILSLFLPGYVLAPARHIFGLVLLLCLCACQAQGRKPLTFDWSRVAPENMRDFEGLLQAIEARENLRAEALHKSLVAKLEAQTESQDASVARDARWQLEAAERFGQILEARKVLDHLEASLRIDDHEGELWLWLDWRSRWPAPLILRPGSAILEQESFYAGPGGEHSSRGQTHVLGVVGPWELPPLGTLSVALEPYRRAPIGGALALRDGFALRLGSGSIAIEERSLPAEKWPAARGLRVNLAGFLPTQVVEVEEWLAHLLKPAVGMPSIVERTVRLRPAEYARALAALRPHVQAATPELIERYRPALQWLWKGRPMPVGIEAWRRALNLPPPGLR